MVVCVCLSVIMSVSSLNFDRNKLPACIEIITLTGKI